MSDKSLMNEDIIIITFKKWFSFPEHGNPEDSPWKGEVKDATKIELYTQDTMIKLVDDTARRWVVLKNTSRTWRHLLVDHMHTRYCYDLSWYYMDPFDPSCKPPKYHSIAFHRREFTVIETQRTGPWERSDGSYYYCFDDKIMHKEFRKYTYNELQRDQRLFVNATRDPPMRFIEGHEHLQYWRDYAALVADQRASDLEEVVEHHSRMFASKEDHDHMLAFKEGNRQQAPKGIEKPI